ncbi:hypothetical protein MMC11_009024 [Xylographa trunciseda]|nr:hypothetical protein [Xylographa trunciseda]
MADDKIVPPNESRAAINKKYPAYKKKRQVTTVTEESKAEAIKIQSRDAKRNLPQVTKKVPADPITLDDHRFKNPSSSSGRKARSPERPVNSKTNTEGYHIEAHPIRSHDSLSEGPEEVLPRTQGRDETLPPSEDIPPSASSPMEVEPSVPQSRWARLTRDITNGLALAAGAVNDVASAIVCLVKGLWLAMKTVRRYWWLIAILALVWPWTNPNALHKPTGRELIVSWGPGHATIVDSLTDFARTFEDNSEMHSIPQYMTRVDLDILFLRRYAGHSGLSPASAAKVHQLCAEYIMLSSTLSTNLSKFLVIHRSSGKKLVHIVNLVIRWLEECERAERERSLVVSFIQYALGKNDNVQTNIRRSYDYLFPETIDVFQKVLSPLAPLAKDVYSLVDIVIAIEGHISEETSHKAKKSISFQESFLVSLGFHSARNRWCQLQLEVLGNITKLIEIPKRRLTESQLLLQKAEGNFDTMRLTLEAQMPTEFVQVFTPAEIIQELRTGSQVITDALERVAIAGESYVPIDNLSVHDINNRALMALGRQPLS